MLGRVASLGVLLGSLAPLACAPSPDRRPDVVWIVVDTLRADAVADPEGRYDTPAIDGLARDGIVFTRAYAHAPMTLPSHTSLFSSRPPVQTGVVNNGQRVPEDLPLLSEWLAQHGYETRAVTSLGTLRPFPGMEPGLARGFSSYDVDYWNIDPAERVLPRIEKTLVDEPDEERPLFLFAHFCDPHEPYDSHADTGRRVHVQIDGEALGEASSENMNLWKREFSLAAGSHELVVASEHRFRIRYLRLLHGAEAVEFDGDEDLQRPRHQARLRFEVPPESAGEHRLELWVADVLTVRESRERYVGEVEHVDRYLGRLIEDLEARGLYDDALVVFTSDHGEALGEQGHVGHVETLREELLHVPLIVKLPSGHPGVERLRAAKDELVRGVDLVPTILDVVGLPPLPGQTGESLLRRGGPRVLVAETHRPEAKEDQIALFDGRFKMVYRPASDSFQLFDLQADPAEAVDCFAERAGERPDWPARLRALAQGVAGGRDETGMDPEALRALEALGY